MKAPHLKMYVKDRAVLMKDLGVDKKAIKELMFGLIYKCGEFNAEKWQTEHQIETIPHNMISGTIPYLISDATSRRSLQTLYLQETFISGTVPPLGCLANLTKLDLHDSEFTGFAPAISTPNSTCGSLPVLMIY